MTTESFGKRDWVELFREIGLDEATMRRWHGLFEKRHPQAHQDFLDWLQIDEQETRAIRENSRGW